MPVTKLNNGQLPTTISSKTIDSSNTINTDLTKLSVTGGTNGQVLSTDGSGALSWATGGGGGGISDGDKGDITVSASGATWTIDNGAVSYAKIQDVSTTSRLLGRATAGAGDVEEITIGTGLSLSGTTLNASGGGGGYQRQVDYFTTSGTWSKPAWAKYITVLLLPGGGAGGSGRRGATTTVRCGGAGGGACGYTSVENLDATSLASSESVIVGSGGIGGASVTTDDTNGNTGGAGGLSSFGSLIATGNNGGGQGGGTSASSLGGSGFGASGQTIVSAGEFVGRSGTTGNGTSFTSSSLGLANSTLGGAGGAGAPANGTTTANGGTFNLSNWLVMFPSLGITFGASGTGGGNGGDGNAYLNGELYINTSGGGGSYKTGQATGNGGSALGYGAGGGGGAASNNGFASGAGGNGGGGLVIVVSEG